MDPKNAVNQKGTNSPNVRNPHRAKEEAAPRQNIHISSVVNGSFNLLGLSTYLLFLKANLLPCKYSGGVIYRFETSCKGDDVFLEARGLYDH